jgi:ESS family glutamate:Na+ symporter
MLTLELDLLQTLTLAAVVYYVGVKLRQRIGILDRLNIPSAVVGGLLFAAVVFALHDRVLNLTLNTAAQPVLNVAFFTTIGMGASLALLRQGGVAVLVFLLFAVFACFAQNGVGMAVASALGESPLLGVMAGSVTLVGGPATGLAFAPLFEEAGLSGAAVIAITSAVFGIVCGGLAATRWARADPPSPIARALPLAAGTAEGTGVPRRLPAARTAGGRGAGRFPHHPQPGCAGPGHGPGQRAQPLHPGHGADAAGIHRRHDRCLGAAQSGRGHRLARH